MLKNYLEEELRLETADLEKLKAKLSSLKDTVLASAKGGFYCRAYKPVLSAQAREV
ncbi:MAG: hypothetical protein IJK95_00480 [Firmicutes bacterium]|nr:hypothetical protein [Bacillota bacterium]